METYIGPIFKNIEDSESYKKFKKKKINELDSKESEGGFFALHERNLKLRILDVLYHNYYHLGPGQSNYNQHEEVEKKLKEISDALGKPVSN